MAGLPPIHDQPAMPEAHPRDPQRQAELERDLDGVFEELGVQRGQALGEALKPQLDVPMPRVQVVAPDPLRSEKKETESAKRP